VIEAYALFLSSLLLIGGALGDVYGRRRVFAIGIVIFAAASIACGLALDVHALIAARAAQGVGAALLVPESLAIISASFPASTRGAAIGTWSAFSAITSAAGPVLGGWLIDHLSWRAAFFINVPVAAAVLLILRAKVPESRGNAGDRLDVAGSALVTLALGCLVVALLQAPARGWRDPMIVAMLAGSALSFVWFFKIEARAPAPIVPLPLFRSPEFTGANALTFLLYGALAAAFFFLPLRLIQVERYTATQAGAAALPMIGLMFLLSRWSGGLIERYGSKLPLVVGPSIVGVGYILFAGAPVAHPYWITFFPAYVTLGLGMALTVAPLTTTVMNAVDQAHAGAASGINNAMSRVGGLVWIAALGILFQRAGSFMPGFRRVMLASSVLAWMSAGCAAVFLPARKSATSGGRRARPRRESR
jgi:EmrB/QacA subfamily drug resistance transporter